MVNVQAGQSDQARMSGMIDGAIAMLLIGSVAEYLYSATPASWWIGDWWRYL